MSYRVLIPQDVAEVGKKYLTDRGYEIKMGSSISEEVIKEEVRDCDAILARTEKLSAEVIEAGSKLKVIGRHGVGVDNIDIKKAEELGIWVTNAPYYEDGTSRYLPVSYTSACNSRHDWYVFREEDPTLRGANTDVCREECKNEEGFWWFPNPGCASLNLDRVRRVR